MPPSLVELQRALAAHVANGEGPDLDDWIRVPPEADRAARVAVYVDGYPARIREALRESFPALAQILGDGSFSMLAERYARAVPADLQNLNSVGAGLPAFLERDRASEDLPFLPALAELEWAVERCFHAPLLPAFELAACSGWSADEWARAQIGFQSGLAVVCAPWPLRELRETYRRERSEIDVDLVDRPDRVLVYRRDFEVVVESIGTIEARAIQALQAGMRLGEVTDELAALDANPADVVGFFSRWASLGLVVSCDGVARC